MTLDNLMSWNPWIDSDCDTSIFAGLDDFEERAICIGANGTPSDLPGYWPIEYSSPSLCWLTDKKAA